MRNLLILLLILCFGFLFPQKKISHKKLRKHHARVYASKTKGTVIVSLDTIYNKGVAYAILQKEKRLPYHYFTLYSFHRDVLIYIRPAAGNDADQTPYYEFKFVASNNIGEAEKYYGFNIEEVVVKYDLVKNSGINPFSEAQFIADYPRKFSDPSIKTYIKDKNNPNGLNGDNVYETVQRNREAKIFFENGKIMQDYKAIGTYKSYESMTRFYLPNGIQIAQATESEKDSKWILRTLKDNKNRDISKDSDDTIKDMINFLVKNLYL